MTARRGVLTEPVSSRLLCLDPEAVYLSPLGRRCRVRVSPFEQPRRDVAVLVYDLQNGEPASSNFGEAFTLSRPNWPLLRKVA